jgi:hypothetical protein
MFHLNSASSQSLSSSTEHMYSEAELLNLSGYSLPSSYSASNPNNFAHNGINHVAYLDPSSGVGNNYVLDKDQGLNLHSLHRPIGEIDQQKFLMEGAYQS